MMKDFVVSKIPRNHGHNNGLPPIFVLTLMYKTRFCCFISYLLYICYHLQVGNLTLLNFKCNHSNVKLISNPFRIIDASIITYSEELLRNKHDDEISCTECLNDLLTTTYYLLLTSTYLHYFVPKNAVKGNESHVSTRLNRKRALEKKWYPARGLGC